MIAVLWWSGQVLAETPDGRKDINEATLSDLQEVPGIGKKTAMAILEARNEAGRFSSMNQLDKVKRIGPKVLSKLVCKFYVPEEGPLPCIGDNGGGKPGQGDLVNLNTDPPKRLMTLPGIGKKKAELIVEYRKQNGWFKSPWDLTKIKGIGKKTVQKMLPRLQVRLEINQARASQFEALGFSNGDNIVRYRDEHGPFASVEALASVPGLDEKTLETVKDLLEVAPAGAPDKAPGTP